MRDRLSPWLVAMAGLGLAFVALTQSVGMGLLRVMDQEVAGAFGRLWEPSGEPLFMGVALLGGIEVTSLVAALLFIYLRRSGFARESWALLSFPLALLVEAVYKRLLTHPGPPHAHPDGPSLTLLLERGGALPNSYPSGHLVRTVVVYGLLAFVVHRLAAPGWPRRLAVPAAAAVVLLVAFDRLYLGVHWESDVLGGLLLGGLTLAGAIAWLEQAGTRT